MKFCGKEYTVPELNFEECEFLERESGVPLYEMVESKHTMSVARAFIQLVVGADASTASSALTQELKNGGYVALGRIMDAFTEAMLESDFFCALLGIPTKAERERMTQEAEKPAEI